MFNVETGVKGAMRINNRQFDNLADAEAFAARVRRSNSTGDYWAIVTDLNGPETPLLVPVETAKRWREATARAIASGLDF